MADGSSIAPTGYEVATTGPTKGTFLGILYRGIDAYVDIETARAAASTPDRGDVVVATQQNTPRPNPVTDIAANLTPMQWAWLAGAAALGYGLYAGWFR
jgi:hypothetical protein